MKRLLFALLACCVLALPCRAEAAGPSPGLLVPVIPDSRTGHYQITVSDEMCIRDRLYIITLR